jgi:hypothetical protein
MQKVESATATHLLSTFSSPCLSVKIAYNYGLNVTLVEGWKLEIIYCVGDHLFSSVVYTVFLQALRKKFFRTEIKNIFEKLKYDFILKIPNGNMHSMFKILYSPNI